MTNRFKECDQCQQLRINGIACHEIGCPNVWLEARDCKECGQAFEPTVRHQRFCDSCWDDLFGFGGKDI